MTTEAADLPVGSVVAGGLVAAIHDHPGRWQTTNGETLDHTHISDLLRDNAAQVLRVGYGQHR